MEENEVRKKMENKLKEIFGYINTWLNFAEAKNGIILAISIGIILNISTYIKKVNKITFTIFIIIILLSIISSLLSFYPNLSNSKIKKVFMFISKCFDNNNIKNESEIKIFYGDIAKNYSIKNSENFVKDLYKDYYGIEDILINQLEIDYATEIIINSKITVNKYNYFKCTIKLIIVFMILFVFFLVWNFKLDNTSEKVKYIVDYIILIIR